MSLLIEVCGEQLIGMQRGSGGWDVLGTELLKPEDIARLRESPELQRIHTQGVSLEEAVANLWLALNTK